MNKNIALAIMALVVIAGVVMAISGATVTSVAESRWNQTAGSDSTEGGNVTVINLATNSTTDKWAAYWGNVSGRIVLSDVGGLYNVFNWTWSAADGGDVCATTGSNFDFTSLQAASPANIDSTWSFTASDADSAVNTFNNGTCTVTFAQNGTTSTNRSKTGPNFPLTDLFYTCPIRDAATTTETDYAFCSLLNASTGYNYQNVSADYELIVPTTSGAGAAETYYFFVELS